MQTKWTMTCLTLVTSVLATSSLALACGDDDSSSNNSAWADVVNTDRKCISEDGQSFQVSFRHTWASCRETQAVTVYQKQSNGELSSIASFSDVYYQEGGPDSLKVREDKGTEFFNFDPNPVDAAAGALKVRMQLIESQDQSYEVVLPVAHQEDLTIKQRLEYKGFKGSLSILNKGKKVSVPVICKDTPSEQLYTELMASSVDGQEIGLVDSEKFLEWLFRDLK